MKSLVSFYNQTDKTIFYCLVFSLACILVIVNIFALYYQKLPSSIPLFYSLPWGESQLVSTTQFAILPAISTLIMLVNFSLIWQLHQSQIVLKRLLAASTLLVSFLLFVTAINIIFIFV